MTMGPHSLDWKVALVAGAPRGAGRGIAVELGRAGATGVSGVGGLVMIGLGVRLATSGRAG